MALNDPARSIRVTIRLKDLFFKKCGSMFDFNNYAKLRSREGWADLKFVSFSRDELAAGMRRHTKDAIHDPLTEVRRTRGALGWARDGLQAVRTASTLGWAASGVRIFARHNSLAFLSFAMLLFLSFPCSPVFRSPTTSRSRRRS